MKKNNDHQEIENLILSYSSAFNAADIPATVDSFTADGILMPNNAPLARGHDELSASFGFLLKTFRIKIDYTIEEIVLSKNHAFARTRSNVSTHVNASGEEISLNNKEIFLLQKLHHSWKISHYIFNNTSTSR